MGLRTAPWLQSARAVSTWVNIDTLLPHHDRWQSARHGAFRRGNQACGRPRRSACRKGTAEGAG